MTGIVGVTLPARPAGTKMIMATAIACDLSEADIQVAMLEDTDTSCNSTTSCCSECVGDPVRTTNGNMRYSETDPVPSNAAFRLTRTYDSRFDRDDPEVGTFGPGWSSVFDSMLTTLSNGSLTDDLAEIVYIRTETNDPVVFRRRTASEPYRQLWPRNATETASLTLEAAGYVYRNLTKRIERTYGFPTGKLIGLRSTATGESVSITWSGSMPTRVDDGRGNWALVLSSAGGQIQTIGVEGLPALTWTFVYDSSSGDLLSIKDAGENAWRSYTYDPDHHNLLRINDALGHELESHQYDAVSGAMDSSGPSGEISSITRWTEAQRPPRVPGERVTTVTYASGATADYYSRLVAGKYATVEIVGACSGCGGKNAAYAYDKFGNVVRQQDSSGYLTESIYDAGTGRTLLSETRYLRPSGCDPAESGAVACRLTANTIVSEVLIDSPAAQMMTYAYADPVWPNQPTAITTASIAAAGQTRQEQSSYDASTGQRLVHTRIGWTEPTVQQTIVSTTSLYVASEGAAFPPGGAFETAWLSLPQPAGALKRLDGPLEGVNDETMWVYYPVNPAVPPVNRGRLAAQRNALGHITRYEDYEPFGNARRIVDPNGVIHESSYDSQGRLLTSTLKGVSGCNTTSDPLCATDLTSTRIYTPSTGPLASEQRPGGGVTVYAYDARGRVLTISRGPSVSDLRERIEYEYESATGFKVGERTLAWESASWLERKSNRYEYDADGRLFRTFHPRYQPSPLAGDYEETTYGPDGIVAAIKDARHTAPNTRYVYDSAGRLAEVRQLADAAGAGTWITTQYQYDLHGNLISVIDPNGNETTYVYDDFGRMILQVSPVTGTMTYDYDESGQLVKTYDANKATTLRSYDELGRVLTADSTRKFVNETASWTYDEGTLGVGRLASMTDPSGVTTYGYDRRGLLLKQVTSTENEGTPKEYTAEFRYDADGNRTVVTYPSAGLATYTHDYAGRPQTVTLDGVTIVSGASYLPFGPRTGLTFGNGTTQTLQYDQRYRVDTNALGGPSGTIASYDYTHDANGNITVIADLINGSYNRSFAYDDLDRLMTANTGSALWGTGSYSYDPIGNMLSATLGSSETIFAYDEPTSKLVTVTTDGDAVDVTYDSAGNETPTGTEISPRNHVLSYEGPEVRMDYVYDGRGVRSTTFRRQLGTFDSWDTIHTVYTPELQVLSTKSFHTSFRLTQVTTGLREIVWFGGTAVAQLDGVTAPRALHYTFTDHLGTPLLQTNAAAQVTWRAEYDPYGTIVEQRAGMSDDQPLRFPGQEVEPGTDLYQNMFRWYRAGWGSYTQADPVGLDAGINLYRYGFANPSTYTDSTGLFVDPSKALEELAKQLLESCKTLTGGPKPLPIFAMGALMMLDAAPTSGPTELAAEALLKVPYPKCAKSCQENNCPPCNPPLGTFGYNYHNPTRPPHPGITGDHVHYFQMQQIPRNCDCFWKNLHIAFPPPPVLWALPLPTSDPWP